MVKYVLFYSLFKITNIVRESHQKTLDKIK
jgi:hypothetical protein